MGPLVWGPNVLGVVNENPHRYESDRQYNQLNTQNDEDRGKGEQNAPETVAHRLREAGLPTDRFIDVEDGQKQSFDHTKHGLDAVSGNYGVYSGRGLVGFDIDDYQDDVDTSALETLPSTFAVETPHGGEHWYYKGGQRVVAVIWSVTGGAKNVSLSWGEIYASGKYLVGPGSRITDCDKSHCDQCKRRGGTYSIEADRPIDEITPEQVLRVLSADTDHADRGQQAPLWLYDHNKEEEPQSWRSESRGGRAELPGGDDQAESEQRRLDSFR